MKLNILLVNLLLIMKSTFAQENGLGNIIESKTVFNPSSNECKVVNRMLGKDDSYDCCNLPVFVECENRHIVKIHIENKNLTGSIPSELGNLIYLRELWLDHNQFSGTIPSSLGNIIYLQDLSLGANELYGSIPPELGKLEDLTKLKLYENKLEENIPAELGNLSNLLELDLHNNTLYGPIPFELGKLSKLQKLNLDNNELDIKSIPQQIKNLPELTEFIYSNQSEHKEKRKSSYLLPMFCVLFIIISILVCICLRKNNNGKKEKSKNFQIINDNESNSSKKPGNDSIVIEANQIAVTMDPPKTNEQPEKSESNVSALQLKKQIDEQEKQLQQQLQQQQQQLQQIQQMKNQLQQYEQPSSSSSSAEPKSYPKTKEQEAQEDRLQNQNLSYGHNTIPMNSSTTSATPVNPNNSFVPTAPPVMEDNPPNYEDVIRNLQ